MLKKRSNFFKPTLFPRTPVIQCWAGRGLRLVTSGKKWSVQHCIFWGEWGHRSNLVDISWAYLKNGPFFEQGGWLWNTKRKYSTLCNVHDRRFAFAKHWIQTVIFSHIHSQKIEFVCVFLEDAREDPQKHCVFVEDAEEDAETIVFLWKTLANIRKYILPYIFTFFSVFHKNTMVLASSSASSIKTQWF